MSTTQSYWAKFTARRQAQRSAANLVRQRGTSRARTSRAPKVRPR